VGQAELTGTITFGPSSGGAGVFPSSSDTIQLESTPTPKQFGAATGTFQRTVMSPSAYTTLSGIGDTDTVHQCNFLYFRCNAPVKIRMTFTDPDGGADIVSILPVQGTIVFEPPSNGTMKLLEIKGSAQIEYGACGLQ
jgi:hypothetical protein